MQEEFSCSFRPLMLREVGTPFAANRAECVSEPATAAKETVMKIHQLKRPLISGLALLGGVAGLSLTACSKSSEFDSDVMFAVSGSSTSEIESALRSKIAFRLNLKTNRATMYKDGAAVDQWNIATADVSGQWHDGVPHYTPTGVFNVEDIQMCPQWYPREPVNPATGRKVTSEQERQQVFARNPQIYGACGSRNPLGKYVLWFNGAYGMHGNSAEEILEFANPNDRRVSGGCVRNPNAKIHSVFHSVLGTFSDLSSFADQVRSMESRSASDRWTLTKGTSYLNMRVVVGNWSADPAVGSTVGTPTAPAAVTAPNPTDNVVPPTPAPAATAAPAPAENPQQEPRSNTESSEGSGRLSCLIHLVDSDSGIAPVYMSVPEAGVAPKVSAFYRMGWPVTVFGKVDGTGFYKVSRGVLDSKYVTRCVGI
ncbi:MAG: hypothetical protein EBR09_00950 [Proteobacteria bacterium]|nr:hypothetical protein [Pseudomonadota bacterium]